MSTAWQIAGRLGLRRSGNAWRGNCPACGYRDALALTERNGRPLWHCASCGDAVALTAHIRGLRGGLLLRPPECPHGAASACSASKTGPALALWRKAKAASRTIAESYVATRGLEDLPASSALRFLEHCPHPSGVRIPALVALVSGPDGHAQAIHRTYLRADGHGKAEVDPAKASLGTVRGGAIRLDPADAELVIGEGIESSASAGRLLGLPAWSAVSCGNLADTLMLPPEVGRVVIAVDHDIGDRTPGQDAAEAAAVRWTREGRHVELVMPDRPDSDFNDLLLERREATNA